MRMLHKYVKIENSVLTVQKLKTKTELQALRQFTINSVIDLNQIIHLYRYFSFFTLPRVILLNMIEFVFYVHRPYRPG